MISKSSTRKPSPSRTNLIALSARLPMSIPQAERALGMSDSLACPQPSLSDPISPLSEREQSKGSFSWGLAALRITAFPGVGTMMLQLQHANYNLTDSLSFG